MAEAARTRHLDSALVVEDGSEQRVQAQFTRLQMALGLKERLKSEGMCRDHAKPEHPLIISIRQILRSSSMEPSWKPSTKLNLQDLTWRMM